MYIHRSTALTRIASGICKRIGFVFLAALLGGCSIKQMAVNKMGDALAAGGSVFTSDDDPELIKAALPFSLKLMESLLAESPRHEGLLYATASGFTQYSYAFVHQQADVLEGSDLTAAFMLRQRARKLYLRARDYGLRGLEIKRPGFEIALRSDPRTAVARADVKDVPMLYWTAASWALAITLSKDVPDLVGDLPIVEALVDRALQLDESYGEGAIHAFLVTYEMIRTGGGDQAVERARSHFERALELSRGEQAGVFLTYAESVEVPRQNRRGFEILLNEALAIDADAHPEYRLVNLISQERARWLLDHADELFLD